MAHKDLVSPERLYEVSLIEQETSDAMVTVITLPDGLANNVNTARIWYQKYIPKGCHVTDIRPVVEAEEQEPEIVGFGDGLDYVGPEEDPNGFTIHEIDDTEEAPEDEAPV